MGPEGAPGNPGDRGLPPRTGLHRLVTRLLDAVVIIETDDPQLAGYLAELFADSLVGSDVGGPLRPASGLDTLPPLAVAGTAHVVHRRSGAEHVLVVDGLETVRSATGWWALSMLIWYVNRRVIAVSSARSLLVHAGAVVRDGRTMLVIGASGAGKTTTTLAFARGGWGYVTDDVALILPDGSVWGSPKPPTIRRGAAELLGLRSEEPAPPKHYAGGDEWWAGVGALGVSIVGGAPLGGVVVLEPSERAAATQAEAGVRPLPRSSAVAAVASASFNLDRSGQSGLELIAAAVSVGWEVPRQPLGPLVAWFDDPGSLAGRPPA